MANLKYIILPIILTVYWNCTHPDSSTSSLDQSFTLPPPEKLDSIASWLNQYDNYLNDTYTDVFQQHFTAQIQAGNIDSAATILDIAGNVSCHNYTFDSALVQAQCHFLQQYTPQISDKLRTNILLNLGDAYALNEQFGTSNYYFKQILSVIPKNYATARNNAFAKNGLMYNYMVTNALDSALILGRDALEQFQTLNDRQGQAYVYATLSGIYKFLMDYPEAEKAGDQAMQLVRQNTDSSAIFITYLDKISLYDELNNPAIAQWIDTLIQFTAQWNPKSPNYTLTANSWRALQLINNGQLTEAKYLLQKIAPLYEQVEDSYFNDSYLLANAQYELKAMKGISDTTIYTDQIPHFKEEKNFTQLILYNGLLHDNAFLKRDYPSAFYYHQQSLNARDSLREIGMQHRIKELDKKYQTKQKELQIELQSSQLSQKNIQISLLLMALILILMLIGIYLWYLRQRQIQKEAHIQTQFTQQLLENIEEERGRIAIDLHDSVSHELLSLKRNFAETPDASGKIDGIIDDIRQISRNLHPVMLDKIGLQLSLETLCDQLMQSENIFVAQDIQYHNSLSKSAELQLFRIAQEALTNAHKYAGAEAVQVQLNDKNGQLSLQIRDNGRGFDVEKALSSGKAFGLHSIIQRSKAIGGQANILSSGQGTVIEVRV